MASGVYKITNTTNGKVYVGSAVNFDTRWKEHIRELRKGTHHSSALQNAWNKYGEDNFQFSIIEECERTRKVLLGREQYWMDTLDSVANGYNIAKTAGSQLGMKQSPEAIAARVEKNTGKKRTAETRALMSEVQSNRSPEWCANIAKAHIGKKHSEATRKKISEATTGRKLSEDHIEKLRGRKHTQETKAHLSEIMKARSPEFIEEIAQKNRGKKRTPEQIAAMSKVQSNRSPEWIEKNAAANRGKKRTPEQRERIRQAHLREKRSPEQMVEKIMLCVPADYYARALKIVISAIRRNKSSKSFPGVREVRNSKLEYGSRLMINKVNHTFGPFDTPEEAYEYRMLVLIELKTQLESKLANPPC